MWNANGGIPAGEGPEAGRRPARASDFFGVAGPEPDDEPGEPAADVRESPFPRTHDGDAEPPEATVSDQLRSAFALFAGPINRKLREQAGQVDAGEPPADPHAN
jgi:hypothetical protein